MLRWQNGRKHFQRVVGTNRCHKAKCGPEYDTYSFHMWPDAGIGLMMWMWISVVILFGAELNAKLSTRPRATRSCTARSRWVHEEPPWPTP
jgi:hypothetical protein